MRQLSKRTSRRVETLKDSDYDHEIGLVDEERRGRRAPPASQPGGPADNIDPQPESAAPAQSESRPIPEAVDREDQFQDAREEFTPRPSQDTQPDTQPDDDADSVGQGERNQGEQGGEPLDNQTTQPSIAVEGMLRYQGKSGNEAANGARTNTL